MAELHLYWLDKTWERKRSAANNYNLVVNYETKTFYEYEDAFYGYHGNRHIEVKRKQDIKDYIKQLEHDGFTREK